MAKKKKKAKTTTKKIRKPQKKVLTQLQENFLREYVVVRNAAEAAKRAGIKGNNYKQRGHQILNDPLVQEKLREFNARKFREREAVFDRMLDRLEYMVCDDYERADITDVLKWDDHDNISMTPYEEITPQARRAIKSLKQIISKSGDKGVAVELKEEGSALAAMKLYADLMGVKDYIREQREKEKAKDAKAQQRAGEVAEQTRMERLLENARLYEKRAGSEGPDNS